MLPLQKVKKISNIKKRCITPDLIEKVNFQNGLLRKIKILKMHRCSQIISVIEVA